MNTPTSVLGVFTELPSYIAAVAELPASAKRVDGTRGSVVVVPGSGNWWEGLLAAREEGAAAVVVAEPAVLPREVLDGDGWPGGIPVIIERPRLRPDVVADALRAREGNAAVLVIVECAAPAPVLEEVVRDGLGWARFLAGGPLALSSATATAHGRMALLDGPGGDGGTPSVSLLATVAGGFHAGGLLQVLGLGEVRTEVLVDQPAVLTRVETSGAEGTLRAPERYEGSARVALRRARQACLSGEPVHDLDELLGDIALLHKLGDWWPTSQRVE